MINLKHLSKANEQKVQPFILFGFIVQQFLQCQQLENRNYSNFILNVKFIFYIQEQHVI